MQLLFRAGLGDPKYPHIPNKVSIIIIIIILSYVVINAGYWAASIVLFSLPVH